MPKCVSELGGYVVRWYATDTAPEDLPRAALQELQAEDAEVK